VSIRVAIARNLEISRLTLPFTMKKFVRARKNRSMMEDRRSRMAILRPPSPILEGGALR
jgi:hypothetical protein